MINYYRLIQITTHSIPYYHTTQLLQSITRRKTFPICATILYHSTFRKLTKLQSIHEQQYLQNK